MEVVRDRASRRIWLSQSEYIAKLERLLPGGSDDKGTRPTRPTRHIRPPRTPIFAVELIPYEGTTTASSIYDYQRKVGSILYAAVISRVDIVYAVSKLPQFNHNPGPQHHKAADHYIQYLLSTQNFALELGGGDGFETWSDASFADNSVDRKSSQAYVMKLFGGVVGWRANKQDTVTTSTTEAELLALVQAVKEALYADRLLSELGIRFEDCTIQLWCDNQQTIGLVTKETATLRTKLKYVNIHNHWLRQEVERGTIEVSYEPTDRMLADGLTKALTGAKFEAFRAAVGVVDISKQLAERKACEITLEDLEAREDLFDGGEADTVLIHGAA